MYNNGVRYNSAYPVRAGLKLSLFKSLPYTLPDLPYWLDSLSRQQSAPSAPEKIRTGIAAIRCGEEYEAEVTQRSLFDIWIEATISPSRLPAYGR